ncbi:MAG TPA: hypothetical protein VF912_20110 [Anaeromyxobacter sp.]
MIRTLAAAALLAAAPLAQAEPGADAAKSYRIETTGTTQQIEVGKEGKLVLAIVPVEKIHVDPRAPLKITLEATPGVRLSRTSLGKADPVDPNSEGRRFEVPFVIEKAGKHEARAKLDFFVCSDQWCVKQVRDVTVALEAKK